MQQQLKVTTNYTEWVGKAARLEAPMSDHRPDSGQQSGTDCPTL